MIFDITDIYDSDPIGKAIKKSVIKKAEKSAWDFDTPPSLSVPMSEVLEQAEDMGRKVSAPEKDQQTRVPTEKIPKLSEEKIRRMYVAEKQRKSKNDLSKVYDDNGNRIFIDDAKNAFDEFYSKYSDKKPQRFIPSERNGVVQDRDYPKLQSNAIQGTADDYYSNKGTYSNDYGSPDWNDPDNNKFYYVPGSTDKIFNHSTGVVFNKNGDNWKETYNNFYAEDGIDSMGQFDPYYKKRTEAIVNEENKKNSEEFAENNKTKIRRDNVKNYIRNEIASYVKGLTKEDAIKKIKERTNGKLDPESIYRNFGPLANDNLDEQRSPEYKELYGDRTSLEKDKKIFGQYGKEIINPSLNDIYE